MGLEERIWELAGRFEPGIVEGRKVLHRNAELGCEEVRRTALIKHTAACWTPGCKEAQPTGVCALMGRDQGSTIGLRADIDAPAVEEKKEVPQKSRARGVMHACGHDGHSGIVLGTAMVLSHLGKEFPGAVELILQSLRQDRIMVARCFLSKAPSRIPQWIKYAAFTYFQFIREGRLPSSPSPRSVRPMRCASKL